MSERDDFAEFGSPVLSIGSVFCAIGRAFLFAVACGVLCLVVAELALGYNMYIQPQGVVEVSCYVPAVLGGLTHFWLTVRRWSQCSTAEEAL